MKITIAKTYKFEYAHRIFNQKKTVSNPETKCRNLHGHSGVVKIYITKDVLDECGMIVDFTNLKPIKKYIADLYDHAIIVSCEDKELIDSLHKLSTCNVLQIGGMASSEQIALFMFNDIGLILASIDSGLKLTRLEFSETDNNMVIVER